MTLLPVDYYKVNSSLVGEARLKLTFAVKEAARLDKVVDEEILDHMKEYAQACLMRGHDIWTQRDLILPLLALLYQKDHKQSLSAGFDRACDYWQGKLISEYAVAGSLILTYHSLFRSADDDQEQIIGHLAFLALTTYLLDEAAATRDPAGSRPFLFL